MHPGMCGICGWLSFPALPEDAPAIITRMMHLMARRGPDDSGMWTDGQHCAVGFQRLAILDLSPAGHQPMLTPDGRYVLVYNGEVYNFAELRCELEGKGIHVRSTGDAEVVLHVLAQYGRAGLQRFNGMFALAFYDTVCKRLLLARDHAGIKPLYYLLSPAGLVFASQYDQILSHPWARHLSVSPEALAVYLRLGYIPAPHAVLQHTFMLEPGTWLEVDATGRINQGKFFEFPLFRPPDLHGAAAYEAVDAAVTRAVRRHLVSDVPVGVFLSGGIDSPLVTAKMRAVSNGPVRAFTIGTQGDQHDETPDASAYAQALGVEHTIEHVAPATVPALLAQVVASCGEPFADYSLFPTMLVSRLARHSVTVVLSGDGGDELFWGYAGRFAAVLEKAGEFHRSPYWARLARWGISRVLYRNGHAAHLRYRSVGEWYRAMHSRIADAELYALSPELPHETAARDLFTYGGWEADETAQWLRWNEFVSHLTMVLLKVDRASMYHSLEVRVPLLDREVIEVALRVDWASCLDIKRRLGKLPLRTALARHLSYQTETKRGFEVPMDRWLRGPLKEIFVDTVLGRQEILGIPFNRPTVQKMFHRHLTGHANYARGLWTLLSFALWAERHRTASTHPHCSQIPLP